MAYNNTLTHSALFEAQKIQFFDLKCSAGGNGENVKCLSIFLEYNFVSGVEEADIRWMLKWVMSRMKNVFDGGIFLKETWEVLWRLKWIANLS